MWSEIYLLFPTDNPEYFCLLKELILTEEFWVKFRMLLVTVVCQDNYDSYFYSVDADGVNFLLFVPCIVDNILTTITDSQQQTHNNNRLTTITYHNITLNTLLNISIHNRPSSGNKTAVMEQNTKLVTFVHCWLKCRLCWLSLST